MRLLRPWKLHDLLMVTWLVGVQPGLEPKVCDPRPISVLASSGKLWSSWPDVSGHIVEGPWGFSGATVPKLHFFLSLFFFLGPQLWHMEVPRLGVESELQPRGIRAASATCATAHSHARSPTHQTRPGIEPASFWILVGFVNHWAKKGTPQTSFLRNLKVRHGP